MLTTLTTTVSASPLLFCLFPYVAYSKLQFGLAHPFVSHVHLPFETSTKLLRRTYVGNKPGQLMDGLKRLVVCISVMFLDEIDKTDSEVGGDPVSVLLKVIDPEHNKIFNDHYLNVVFDLSKVIFEATANWMQLTPALLDKCDLIPAWPPKGWLRVLSKEYPILVFHASINKSFGKVSFLNVMRQFARLENDKQAISIGFVGYPNVGRPSVINTLRTKNVCKIASIPEERKVWQYIILTKRVFLIDYPDVVYHNTEFETDVVLKGAVRVTNLQDVADHIGEVWKHMKKEHLERVYKIKEWEDEIDLLVQLCKSTSKRLNDGEPNPMTTSKMVFHDWHQDVEGNAHSDRHIQVPFVWFYALSMCLADEVALLLLYSKLQGNSVCLQFVFVLTNMDTLLSIPETLDDFLYLSISSNTCDSQYRVLEWQKVTAKIEMQRCAASVQQLNEGIALHTKIFSTEDRLKGFVMLMGIA